ncbi:MAG: hypothetical protein ACI841_002807, partial [Planctomycetota bacterium]
METWTTVISRGVLPAVNKTRRKSSMDAYDRSSMFGWKIV